MINGQAHGPQRGTATCQLHMRKFTDGDEIVVEPWRAAAFPIIKDLMVDRGAFDRIVEAGGFITAADRRRARRQPDPDPQAGRRRRRWTPPSASAAARAWRRARTAPPTCSPAAKIAHLNLLPQGQAERFARTEAMVETMERVLRLVHEPRRVRGGVPEGDLDRRHRPDERRLPARRSSRTASRCPGPDRGRRTSYRRAGLAAAGAVAVALRRPRAGRHPWWAAHVARLDHVPGRRRPSAPRSWIDRLHRRSTDGVRADRNHCCSARWQQRPVGVGWSPRPASVWPCSCSTCCSATGPRAWRRGWCGCGPGRGRVPAAGRSVRPTARFRTSCSRSRCSSCSSRGRQ